MSTASSIRRRGPYIPCIKCPGCGRIVKRGTSSASKHPGWVYYKCEKHGRGCVFWNWEMEYVHYLVEHNYLYGDAGVEAVGWAEERREELCLRQAEESATSPAQEEMVLKMMSSVVELWKEAVMLLRVVVVLLSVCCLVLIVKK